MSETKNSQINTDEKRQWILKMIKEYGDEEDQNLERNEILSYDENVERIFTIFLTKDKNDRDILLEKYREEAEEKQGKLSEEYSNKKEELDKLVQEMKKLILKFEDMRQKNYDEEEADELLDNIE